jgi:hypothetical protein
MMYVLLALGCWFIGSFFVALAVGAWIQSRSRRLQRSR